MQPNSAIPSKSVKSPKIPRVVPELHFQFSDGSISKWDQSNWRVDRVPFTRFFRHAKEAASRRFNGQITDFDHTLLETIAQCKVLNENQIRRLLSVHSSFTHTSKRIKKLEDNGMIEKRKFIGERVPDEFYPAIISLTDMGKDYITLTSPTIGSLGSSDFIRSPKLPMHLVASNEIRTQLVERNVLGDWIDHLFIPDLGNVHCVGEIQTSTIQLKWVIERISSMARIDKYIYERISKYIELAKAGNQLIDGNYVLLFLVPSNQTIQDICIHYNIAELCSYYPVWFISHEDLFSPKGIERGIIEAEEAGVLKRLHIPL